jgi:endonuclease YncB( thermonuclease family)
VKHFLAVTCCAIICAGGWAHGETTQPGSGQEFTAKVIAVLDGDTVLIRRNGSLMKIRLAEIDAPEKAQAFGSASRDSLAGMVLHWQVRITPLAIDKYERTVAQLKLNGLNVNKEMVRRGMAWEYSNYHSDRRYIALQQEARQAGRGLWAQHDPTPPWEWRKQHEIQTNVSPVLSPDDFKCGTKHRCDQMRSCDEAFYYFTVCGLKALNPKGDGLPCEKLCAGGSRS